MNNLNPLYIFYALCVVQVLDALITGYALRCLPVRQGNAVLAALSKLFGVLPALLIARGLILWGTWAMLYNTPPIALLGTLGVYATTLINNYKAIDAMRERKKLLEIANV